MSNMSLNEAIEHLNDVLSNDKEWECEECRNEHVVLRKFLQELQQYRSIGTVEEYREAVERQTAKKPIMKPYFDDMEEEYLCCPTCGDILTDRIPAKNEDFYFHCLNCGQKFSWEESEGEDD